MTDLHVTDDDLFGRIHDLVTARMGGALTAEQFAPFERLLSEDAGARRLYVQYVYETVALPSLVGPQSCQWEFEPEMPDDSAAAEAPSPSVLGFLGNGARWTREYFSQPGPLSILAAAIFMVCLISILSILPAPTYERSRSNHACTTSPNSPGRQPRDKKGKLNLVARITGLHNCRWSPDGRAPLGYDHMAVGRELKLDSGLLKITYYNGAQVVLEGPVEFTVEKANTCRLDVGKLTAKVSQQAIGFTVETPITTIVDLGTKFGVEVEQGGTADVHVFVGEVEVAQDVGGTRRKMRLGKGQSVRFDAKGRMSAMLTVDRDRFLRHIPSSWNTFGPDHFYVLAHYRLGEDDPGAVAESPGNTVTNDDRSRRSRHLEKYGSPSYTADTAAPGSSLAMDFNAEEEGDDHYYCAKSPVFVGTDNWILEAWVNADSTSGEAYVAYNGDAGANGYGLELKDGEWFGLFGGVRHLDFNVAATANQWTHLALVREAGTTSLYVGGTAAARTSSVVPNTPASQFDIGALSLYPGYAFDGQIDEVRLSVFTGPFNPGMLLLDKQGSPTRQAKTSMTNEE